MKQLLPGILALLVLSTLTICKAEVDNSQNGDPNNEGEQANDGQDTSRDTEHFHFHHLPQRPIPRDLPVTDGDRSLDRALYTSRCGSTINVRAGNEYRLRSPNFPNRYGDNVNCRRRFNVPANVELTLTCNTFHVHSNRYGSQRKCWGDFITVTEGDETALICGQELNNGEEEFVVDARPQSHTVNFDFTSNHQNSRTGFDCILQAIRTVESPEPAPPPPSPSPSPPVNSRQT